MEEHVGEEACKRKHARESMQEKACKKTACKMKCMEEHVGEEACKSKHTRESMQEKA
jgi:hypothetical protein